MSTTAIASVSIRVTGDGYDPDVITRVLGFAPTLSYYKGSPYRRPGSERELKGMTTLWLLDLSKVYPDSSIDLQLEACSEILKSAFIGIDGDISESSLGRYIKDYNLKFLVSVFYFISYYDEAKIDGDRLDRLNKMVSALGGEMYLEAERETAEDVARNIRLSA